MYSLFIIHIPLSNVEMWRAEQKKVLSDFSLRRLQNPFFRTRYQLLFHSFSKVEIISLAFWKWLVILRWSAIKTCDEMHGNASSVKAVATQELQGTQCEHSMLVLHTDLLLTHVLWCKITNYDNGVTQTRTVNTQTKTQKQVNMNIISSWFHFLLAQTLLHSWVWAQVFDVIL